MKMNSRKRQLVTSTIAESSRIQTKKFFVRENIKKQLLKERDEVSWLPFAVSTRMAVSSFRHSPEIHLFVALETQREEDKQKQRKVEYNG